MKKGGSDYFTLQPMRGSSPTTSLAADMSSNLHVDQRYVLPCIGTTPFWLTMFFVAVLSSQRRDARSSHQIYFSRLTHGVSICAPALRLVVVLTSPKVEGTTTPLSRWEGVTTPPIPSSSPCFVPDSMDISPLPHKAPFSFLDSRTLPLPSPSPEVTPSTDDDDDDDMLSPCDLPTPPQFAAPTLEVPRPVSAVESVL